jgi:hypothetical protein
MFVQITISHGLDLHENIHTKLLILLLQSNGIKQVVLFVM